LPSLNIRCNAEVDALYIEYPRLKIERAEAAIPGGKTRSHEQVVSQCRQWFDRGHFRGPQSDADA
jgi:hypothetical protein